MKVSILIVTHNHQSYILDAIESILMQKNTFETEIICLDDASTDETFELASTRLSAVKNARVIKNEKNLGVTKNYQKGFGLCKGEFVFVLEGDDYWLDVYKVQQQVEFLEQRPFCSMSFHPFLTEKSPSGEIHDQFPYVQKSGFDLFGINEMILNEGLIANFSVCCYRKKFLDQLPAALFEVVSYDWIVNICMASFGLLGRLNTTMSVYRLSQTGVWSNKQLKEKLNDTISLIPAYDRVLDYRYADLFQKKTKLLKAQVQAVGKSQTSSRSFVPPLFIYLAKLIMPPTFWSYLKKNEPCINILFTSPR